LDLTLIQLGQVLLHQVIQVITRAEAAVRERLEEVQATAEQAEAV
jgi:hypothetical protein